MLARVDPMDQKCSFSVSAPENLSLINNLHFLASREVGLGKEINTSDVLAMKASQLQEATKFKFRHQLYPPSSINFTRSDCNNGGCVVLGQGKEFPSIMYVIEVDFRPKCFSNDEPDLVTHLTVTETPRGLTYPIIDACLTKVQNSEKKICAYVADTNLTQMNVRGPKGYVGFYIMDDYALQMLHSLNSQLFSCAFSEATDRFAAGSLNKLFLYEALNFSRSIEVPGMPTALEFDKTGNLIYMGDVTAGLRIEDLRTPPARSNSSIIYPGRVSELKLLSDETAIILSEGENLIKVDLRTERVVLNYPGPHLRDIKVPFSVCEKADILCSTGLNNVTKLWSLSNSTPLCTIKPNSPCDVESCIVSMDNQWGVALFHNNNVHIFEP